MIAQFFSIGLIALLGAMLPGPDFGIVVKNTLLYTRRAGYFTAFGLGGAICIHMTYCALGLALLIAQSPLLFHCIKYAGAAYLIYLGISMLMIAPRFTTPDMQKQRAHFSDLTAFKQGFLCNLLNPKATLFFLSLFTGIVTPHTPFIWRMSIGIEIIIIATSWFCCLTTLLSHPRIKKMLEKAEPLIAKLLGICLIGFGLSLAW